MVEVVVDEKVEDDDGGGRRSSFRTLLDLRPSSLSRH